ncbi:transglycosylase family protein [Streptomyces natalensis]
MALPLFAASGAQAADATTWDKVAQCESGGMWSANSGNGFYGGLQLTQEMWDQHGGSAYAERPDLASRAEQIAVAESLLHDRGPDTWPSCAVHAGLTKGGHAPDVDPGSTPTPRPEPTGRGDSADPSGPSDGDTDGPSADPSDGATGDQSGDPSHDSSGDASDGPSDGSSADPSADPSDGSSADPSADPSGDPSADPSGDQTADPSGDPSDDASDGATPSPSAPGTSDPSRPAGDGSRTDGPDSPEPTPAKGRHRRETDPGQDGKGEDGTGRPGRHASRGGDAHRTGPGGGRRTDPSAPADGYTVRPGDTLSGIAEAHDLPGGWPALYDRNEKAVGADPDLIRPGQLLDLGHKEG